MTATLRRQARRRDFLAVIVVKSGGAPPHSKSLRAKLSMKATSVSAKLLECDTSSCRFLPEPHRPIRHIDYSPITSHHSLAKAFGVHLS